MFCKSCTGEFGDLNSKSTQQNLENGVDLVATSVTANPADFKVGDLVEFEVVVKNQGLTDSPSSWLVLRFFIDGKDVAWLGTNEIIAAGQSITLKSSADNGFWQATQNAGGLLKVIVDEQSAIDEENESNNIFTSALISRSAPESESNSSPSGADPTHAGPTEADPTHAGPTEAGTAPTDRNDSGTHSPITEAARVNNIETIVNDMTSPHEAVLSGIPTWYSWGTKPEIQRANPPDGWTATVPWGQIYREKNTDIPENTRVEIASIKQYYLSKASNKWVYLGGSTTVDGAYYVENFSTNTTAQADKRIEPGGTVSIRLQPGYTFHFYAKNRFPIDGNDINGMFITAKLRLILDDPGKPDDRNAARLLVGVGGDWWENMSASFDNFKTNLGIVIGRHRFVTNDWQYFNSHTLTADAIRQTPPPME